jgi:AcrR family transcriptional regulator
MTPDERRAAIVVVTIPLLRQWGADVTTKQIAEAAGVAEGTLFRAFGDKESLIRASLESYMDPQPFRESLLAIDRRAPLDEKIHQIIELMQHRFQGIFGLMAAVGHRQDIKPGPEGRRVFAEIISELLEPDLDRLSVSGTRAAEYIRLLAFATSLPEPARGVDVSSWELTNFIVNGITSHAPPQSTPSSPPSAESFTERTDHAL